MATIVENIQAESAEAVALKLLGLIAACEGKAFHASPSTGQTADRKWVLDTYRECLNAASGHRLAP